MGLPSLSQVVWAYIMTPTPTGVGHLIGGWKRRNVSLSLKVSSALSLSAAEQGKRCWSTLLPRAR